METQITVATGLECQALGIFAKLFKGTDIVGFDPWVQGSFDPDGKSFNAGCYCYKDCNHCETCYSERCGLCGKCIDTPAKT